MQFCPFRKNRTWRAQNKLLFYLFSVRAWCDYQVVGRLSERSTICLLPDAHGDDFRFNCIKNIHIDKYQKK